MSAILYLHSAVSAAIHFYSKHHIIPDQINHSTLQYSTVGTVSVPRGIKKSTVILHCFQGKAYLKVIS